MTMLLPTARVTSSGPAKAPDASSAPASSGSAEPSGDSFLALLQAVLSAGLNTAPPVPVPVADAALPPPVAGSEVSVSPASGFPTELVPVPVTAAPAEAVVPFLDAPPVPAAPDTIIQAEALPDGAPETVPAAQEPAVPPTPPTPAPLPDTFTPPAAPTGAAEPPPPQPRIIHRFEAIAQPLPSFDTDAPKVELTRVKAADLMPVRPREAAEQPSPELPRVPAVEPPASGLAAAAPAPPQTHETTPSQPSDAVRPAAPLADQIGEGIVTQARLVERGGKTDFILELHPPELGKVHIHLQSSQEGLSARLFVADEGARQLIEGQLAELRQRLHEAACPVVRCSVGDMSGGWQPRQQQQQTWQQPSAPAGAWRLASVAFAASSPGAESDRLDVVA